MSEEKNLVPAVSRALRLMELLFSEKEPKTLRELSEALDVPTASLFRILKELRTAGYVTVLSGSPVRYAVGHRPFQLVAGYRSRFDSRGALRPVMEELTAKTGQTAQYAIFQNGRFMYTEQVLSASELNFIAQLYTPLEVNTSAGAKIILASLPEEARDQYLEGITLHRRTAHTIDTMDGLKRELALSRERGFGLDLEEVAAGIGCMAVPILNEDGSCHSAIGVTGHIEEYRDPESFRFIHDCLTEAAEKLRQRPW